MSIATAITAAQGKVADAYTAVSAKGGTLPATQNLTNLATAIGTISGGSGIKVYGKNYLNGTIISQRNNIDGSTEFVGVTAIDAWGLQSAYQSSRWSGSTPNRNVYFSDLLSVDTYGLQKTFYGTNQLDNVYFTKMTTTGSYSLEECFYGCGQLKGVYFPELTTIGGQCFRNAFRDCSQLQTVEFPKVTTLDANAFNNAFTNCYGGLSAKFYASTITGTFSSPFSSASNSNIYFYNYNAPATDPGTFTSLISYGSNVTVHFPAACKYNMSSWSSVANGMGNTSTTILWDIQTATVNFITNANIPTWISCEQVTFKNDTVTDFESIAGPGNRDYVTYFPNSNTIDYNTVTNLAIDEVRNVTVSEPASSSTLTVTVTDSSINNVTFIADSLEIPVSKDQGVFTINTSNSTDKVIKCFVNSITNVPITLTGSTQSVSITPTVANYTTTGTIDIDSQTGASGFSSSNYLSFTVPQTVPTDGFEIIAKFYVPAGNSNASNYPVLSCTNSNAEPITVYGSSFNRYLGTRLPSGSNVGSYGAVGSRDVPHTIWAKYVQTSTGFSMYHIVDNNYTLDTLPTTGWSTTISGNTTQNIVAAGQTMYIGRSADLTNFYLYFIDDGKIFLDTLVIRNTATPSTVYWEALS